MFPLKFLFYIGGLKYGAKKNNFYRILFFLFNKNYEQIAHLTVNKLKSFDKEKREELNKLFWQMDTTRGWEDRAFENVQNRKKAYAYQAVNELLNNKPLKILEFGCMNGGSLNCLLNLDYPISHFHGIDISEESIKRANLHFTHQNFKFYCEDFITFCSKSSFHYDIILVKQTFLFLEQEYIRDLLSVIYERTISKYIIIQEQYLPPFPENNISTIPERVKNLPLNYTHDYFSMLKEVNYKLFSGGIIDIGQSNKKQIEAIFERSD